MSEAVVLKGGANPRSRSVHMRELKWLLTSALTAISLVLGDGVVQSQTLETIPATEELSIKAIASQALGELQKRYDANAPLVRRDAHAKAHGCVKATFRVASDLPAELQIGLVSRPGQEYRAWVRFSNGAFTPGADTGMDGRGMALKIMGASSNAGAVTSHDILMINHPAFFSPNADDYLEFATAGALTGDGDGLKRYFFPSYNPVRWRIRQGLIAFRIARQKIASPLSTQYFSMAPFSFGVGRAVKYSAKPCLSQSSARPNSVDQNGSDYLRETMRQELRDAPACFDLMVQERQSGMPVEDATVEWSGSESPFRPIGRIVIPQQEFDSTERTTFCENITFNPWNAPTEHRPLGGINRVRKLVYEEVSRYRHSRNKVASPDPAEAWDRP